MMAYSHVPSLLQRATKNAALVLIRQSTHIQRLHNLGSGGHQRSMVQLACDLGWHPTLIEAIDAGGESGSRGPRETFHRLLARVQAGGIGAVLIARTDRLGRNALTSEELVCAAADHGTLIITEGRIYDPANASDKLVLGMLNQFAEYENRARTSWMMATRYFLAQNGGYRVVLPTGLVWGSPEDPEFVKRLSAAGLDDCLKRLHEHTAVSLRRGVKHYVLPFPDREVYEACRIRMEVMLQQGDLDAVIDAIRTRPDYPRPGKIPVTKAISRYHPDIAVHWLAIDRPQARAILRKWFKSPALYGTYAFTSHGLAKEAGSESGDDFRVRLNGAFPGFASPADEARVRRIANADSKPWRMGRYPGPRPHLMRTMRCGRVGADGQRCGRGLYAMYQPDGSYSYFSHSCRYEDHATQYIRGTVVDRVIEDVLLEAIDPVRLRSFMETVRVEADAGQVRLRDLNAEFIAVDREIKGLTRAVVQAELDDAPDRKVFFNVELDGALLRRRAVEQQIAAATADLHRFRELAQADRRRLLELAADVGRLLQLAREVNPRVLRMLTSEMVETIYFDRLSSYVCRVEIVFPGGETVERHFVTRRMFVTRAAIEYAAGEVARGTPLAELVRTLNLAQAKDHRAPWDEERVAAAPYVLAQRDFPALRNGDHASLRSLAAAHGVAWEDLFVPAVHGHFGSAYYEDGELHVAPELAELHRWVPEIAKRYVAEQLGCGPEDLITRGEASALSGLNRTPTVRQARRNSGLGIDAAGHHWVLRRDFMRSRRRT
jgi:DNA invertase Pin-like site-specific DNA recombinase